MTGGKNLKLNGKEYDVKGVTVEELLEKFSYMNKRIAVEVNGKIVKKDDYKKVLIKEEDTIEVVSFVGGG